MEKQVKEFVAEKVKELMAAPSCCAEAKKAGQDWLDALGTEKEMEQTKCLLAELEADIMPVDGLIAFAGTETAVEIFGPEGAKDMARHGKALKKAGAKYCDCSACALVAEILEKKDEML
ncbi:MAG TPA: molecular chaperone Hsp90 [Candidatus Blautia pullicola]|uniref:Molecular chaperone Hsp90 n=1 Tax=Candidatus Blautia pullicola TaxID=2838498 RepID=A0A9D2FRY4_9FIRM|nr:molecular chaperone Hsp90 [Candidatus Blautia pullicola]